ncbi:hypothetical protein R3P38DRAFT_2849017 [Favolaschia claudopus]|uniref:Uncharacterized protein n=1 Tax=Favolaschia claudopus TaxID=2862362 RepID=A0AAW0DYP1_9AGAR
MSEQVASTSAATTAPTHTEASPAAAAVSGTETAEHDHEHKKHGLSAVIDKIVHPHGDHKEHKEHTKADPPIVEVAVPAEASDGGAHLAPAGSGVGGIL